MSPEQADRGTLVELRGVADPGERVPYERRRGVVWEMSHVPGLGFVMFRRSLHGFRKLKVRLTTALCIASARMTLREGYSVRPPDEYGQEIRIDVV